ncbi:sugar phosphate isomerase/epimerase, partial [candidate division KSB1 bacterium]|nr:sugar phosphate isomerase/epimerase [candidate division KSB1 bacterium]
MNDLFDAQVPRRNFLKWSLGTIAVGSVLGASCGKQEEVQQAKVIPVGLQLYSVRKECEKDLPGTIAAVARMGYQGVEFAGYYNYTAEELRKMLDDNGLKCCGTHIGLDTLMGENFEATVEFNKVLGNKYLIVPWIGEEYRNSK